MSDEERDSLTEERLVELIAADRRREGLPVRRTMTREEEDRLCEVYNIIRTPRITREQRLARIYKPAFYIVPRKRKRRARTNTNVSVPIARNDDDGDLKDFEQPDCETPSEKLRNQWQLTLPQLAINYIKFIGTYGEPDLRAIEPVGPPKCEVEHCQLPKHKKKIFIYFLLHAGEFEFEFCSCKSLPQQLVEMGLMPSSPSQPGRAIHFGCLFNYNAMRDKLGASGDGMARHYNAIHPRCSKPIPGDMFQNLLPLYNQLLVEVDTCNDSMKMAS